MDDRLRLARAAAEQLLLALGPQQAPMHDLAKAIDRYRLEHLLIDGLAANTIAWREAALRTLRERFGRRALEGRWRDAAALLYRDGTPSMASQAVNTLGRILNLARGWGWRTEGHDLAGLCRIRSTPRDRVLSLVERRALLAALELADTPRTCVAADVVRFALHTGWRSHECTTLQWKNIAADFGSAYLPSTKAGPQTRALGQQAAEILERQPSRHCSVWVFPRRRGDGPIHRRQAEQAMTAACKAAGIRGASMHTLRHTRATVSAQCQLPTTIVALALGHTVEHQTSRYQHVDLDSVRQGAAIVDAAMLGPEVPRG
jgi:integrase